MEACKPSVNNGTTKRPAPNDFLRGLFKKPILNLPPELPAPEQCCCCLPNRNGFFLLAYFKLILSAVLLFGIIHYLQLMYLILSKEEMFKHGLAWTAMCIDIVDIVIGVVVIVSVIKKNQRLMEVYYRCSIYVLGVLSLLCCLLFHFMYGDIYALLVTISIFVIVMLMQVYLNKMVKIEVLKLRNITSYRILNDDQESLYVYKNDH